jgi:murein DD-endopeptidase MepM/ murein hydrolase activator NlpD
MTRTGRTFPAAFRVLAMACAVVALAVLAPTAGAGPSQQQVDNACDSFEAVKDKLQEEWNTLHQLQVRLAARAALVDRQEGELEKITVDLVETRDKIGAAQDRFEELRAQLNERSAEAFMNGPSSNLGFLLDATSFSDFSDRLEFVDAATSAGAALAQEVAALRYGLEMNEADLTSLREKQVAALGLSKELRDQTIADLDEERRLRERLAADTARAERNCKERKKELQQFLQQQQNGGHDAVPLPPGYADVLEVCPVDQPRTFGDGFGAPRYAGGYHLHGGVDILAPYGTAIRAPFDGQARTTTSTLGGLQVYVEGRYGYVFNAHLRAYSSHSNGPVHTGDVIGYVGDTGDAAGTPHDHFEFHPNEIPSGWPVSAYGYSVIGTAVNPYPLLVAACG